MTTVGVQFMDATTRNAETERHDRALESIQSKYNDDYLAELRRSNMAREQLQASSNVINDNHYTRMDAETLRNNIAQLNQTMYRDAANTLMGFGTLAVRQYEADTSRFGTMGSVQANLMNAETNRYGAVTSRYLGVLNANTAAKEADTNALNAATRQGELKVKQLEAENTKAYNETYAKSVDNQHWFNQSRIVQDFLNYNQLGTRYDAQNFLDYEKSNSESYYRGLDTAKFGLDVGKTVSSEAREWVGVISPFSNSKGGN